MYHIVPTMIHWLYTDHVNSIKYKMKKTTKKKTDSESTWELLELLITKQAWFRPDGKMQIFWEYITSLNLNGSDINQESNL